MTETSPLPRIAIAGMAIESSTFSPHRAGERDFLRGEGEELITRYDCNVELVEKENVSVTEVFHNNRTVSEVHGTHSSAGHLERSAPTLLARVGVGCST